MANPKALEEEFGPARSASGFMVLDEKRGKIRFKFMDRINVDDVILHLIERELFRLVGGNDPGEDLNPSFKDFLIREKSLKE